MSVPPFPSLMSRAKKIFQLQNSLSNSFARKANVTVIKPLISVRDCRDNLNRYDPIHATPYMQKRIHKLINAKLSEIDKHHWDHFKNWVKKYPFSLPYRPKSRFRHQLRKALRYKSVDSLNSKWFQSML